MSRGRATIFPNGSKGVNVSTEHHERLTELASEKRETIGQFVANLIDDYLSKHEEVTQKNNG